MTAAVSTPLLFDAEQTLERLGLTGEKSVYWLNEQARKQIFPCTMVGRTRKWSEQDMAEIIAICHAPARNKFRSK